MVTTNTESKEKEHTPVKELCRFLATQTDIHKVKQKHGTMDQTGELGHTE